MELENCFTKGTKGIQISGDNKRSNYFIPSNEDYSMVMEVLEVKDGVVRGKKVWDEEGKDFYALLKFLGQDGRPSDNAISVGSHVIFHRVGDFNSPGSTGFELHKEDDYKSSFVCFVSSGLTYVLDLGDGTGHNVEIDPQTGSWYTPIGYRVLPLRTLDNLTFFHNGKPPFKANRIYLGFLIAPESGLSYYLVDLQGHSTNAEKVFAIGVESFTFTLSCDTAGNVLDFTIEGTAPEG
jgi:hypothetical protein